MKLSQDFQKIKKIELKTKNFSKLNEIVIFRINTQKNLKIEKNNSRWWIKKAKLSNLCILMKFKKSKFKKSD